MADSGATLHRRAADDSRLRRDIGTVGLLFTAVGSIIGSGWLFGALSASQIAGPGAVVAWCIGGVMMVLIGLCYAELGAMFPVSGGLIRYPHYAFGSFASYTLGWITWVAAASTASIEVLAALQYSTNYLPWLQRLQDGVPVLTLPGLAVAIAMLALFSLVNVVGIRWFARLNNALVWWKLAIIVLTVGAIMATSFNGANFTHTVKGGFLPFGWSGVFSSIATAGIVFSYLGFGQGVHLAGESRNPQRSVPIAVIGSAVICGIIYVLLQIAFIGALPPQALAHGWAHIGTSFSGGVANIAAAFGPLAALATVMGLSWLAVLLYVDAVISPADTGLIYTTVTARISYAMGRNGNAPRSLARVNERGVPWISVMLTFVAGVIFFLPFPGWQKLVGFVTSATVLSFGSGPLALLAMRRRLPRQERPFRLPAVGLITYLAFLSSNLIVYWSGWDTVWKLMVAVLVGYVVLAIHEGRYRRSTPPLEWGPGIWVALWLAGLTLLSWLGSYPQVSSHAGNRGMLSFGSAIIVFALFSGLIMWLAVSRCLPTERMEAHLSDPASGTPAQAVSGHAG
ncbi:MAG TPA: APC family permease [Steroidobacteraceae bacterium]|jgi:amino acid transporter|nr:APC family permease [Steroidobacteraceae bacterium]